MLRVSWPEYLFDPLQQLLPPDVPLTLADGSHRLHLRSVQSEQQMKLCTNIFRILDSKLML